MLRGHLAKDARLLLRDRKGLAIAVLLPAVIVLVYSRLNLALLVKSGRNPDAFILTLATAFPVLLVATTALVAERRAGTFQRIARSPASMMQFVASKSLAATALLTTQVVALFGVSAILMPDRVLSAPAGLVAVLLATGLAAHSFGILLSAAVTTEAQASQLTALLFLLMLTLSGFLQPLDQLGSLGAVAAYSPVALGYAGASRVLAGASGAGEVLSLVVASAIFLTISGVLSRARAS